jgi:hypothetical protein
VFSFEMLLHLSREMHIAGPKVRAEWWTGKTFSGVIGVNVDATWDVQGILLLQFMDRGITVKADTADSKGINTVEQTQT